MTDQVVEEDIDEQEELWDDEEEEEDEFGMVCGEETCDLEGYEEDPQTHKKKIPDPPDVQEYYSRSLSAEYPCLKCGKPVRWGGLCPECTRAANDAIVETTIEVSPELWDAWEKLYSADTLASSNHARGIIHYRNKTYVNHGMHSGGNSLPTIHASECVPQDNFHGHQTYFYNQLEIYNGSGGMFHCNYERFDSERQMWVILPDQVTYFVRKDEPVYQQTSMF